MQMTPLHELLIVSCIRVHFKTLGTQSLVYSSMPQHGMMIDTRAVGERHEVLDDLAAGLGMGEHLLGRRPGANSVLARLTRLGRDAHGDAFPASWMFRAGTLT